IGITLDSELEILDPTENSLIQSAELMKSDGSEISDQGLLIGSELENLDSTKLPLLTEPVELVTGLHVFEQRFQALLETYPNINRYLQDLIYLTWHSWVRVYISRIFIAGMQSTQRVESINAIIHKAVSSSSTMSDVVEALDSQMQKEAINKDFLAWKYKLTTYYQPFVVDNFFSEINATIKKYFSTRIIAEIHKQMCESVLYKCEKLLVEEAFKFTKDQLNPNEPYENLTPTDNSEGIKNIEDYYDHRQIYFKSLLNSVEKNSVKEIWQIIPYILPKPFIETSSKNLNQADNVFQKAEFIPKHYDNIQEVQTRQHLQKKIEYGRLIGHFKKALSYSLKDNDQSGLDDIILVYISEKEAKLNNEMQSERENVLNENMNSDNVIKLSDDHVYNVDNIKDPTKHKGKGRPAGKRIKAYNEKVKKNIYEDLENPVSSSSDNTSGRKYRLCNKTGHYAPRCP
ncbi:11266_t:CDS:2, partial [Racocetra fulgida]